MRPVHGWLFVLALLVPGWAGAYEVCGSLENGYGPFDYRTRKDKLPIVERHHFNSNVEMLVRGITGSVGGDIDYTLRAFPNHHRALASMANLALRRKTERPRGAQYTVPCYFERAIRFARDDGNVRMIYGTYLLRKGDANGAREQMELASKLVGENANLHYNLGLVYFDLKEYELARSHAKRAYDMGFPLPGLREKLQRAKQWD
jgi:tetratricopeptide (TPR) repeat protein